MRLIDADATIKTLEGLTEQCGGVGAALVKALVFAALKSQSILPTVGGWVSVKDRLPEAGVKCLIRDMKDAAIGMYMENGIWQWADGDFYAKGGITHWMPLPEPPKEEKE